MTTARALELELERRRRQRWGGAWQALATLDDRLRASGQLPLTAWWRTELQAWYESGARRFVGRVGRGGIKSTTAVKVAFAEMLSRDWNVPTGERHYFAIVSVSMSEARQRLGQLLALARAAGIECDRVGDEVHLRHLPLGLKVFAATVGAVSGFRCIGFCGDELAKWRSADDSANPAPEVLASMRAMCVTHPEAREFLISSPWSTIDAHAEAFAVGTTLEQRVAYAPSWVANPTITEQRTHELEPDPRKWSREYAAIPDAQESAAFDPSDVEFALGLRVDPNEYDPHPTTLVLDPSSLRGDSFVAANVRWLAPALAAQRALMQVTGWRWWDFGQGANTVRMGEIVTELCRHGTASNAFRVVSDQREDASLETLFQQGGMAFQSYAWTAPKKEAAVSTLRRLMRERAIAIEYNDRVRRQLLEFRGVYSRTGSLTYSGRGANDDFVAVLITATMALAGDAPGAGTDPTETDEELAAKQLFGRAARTPFERQMAADHVRARRLVAEENGLDVVDRDLARGEHARELYWTGRTHD